MFYLLVIMYLIILVAAIVVILITIGKAKKNVHQLLDRTIFFEIVFMVVGPLLGFYRYDDYPGDIPFNKELDWLLIVPVFLVIGSYWLSKYYRSKRKHGFGNIFLILLSVGLLITMVTTIHFGGFMVLGVFFPLAGFELLAPLISFLLLLKELKLLYEFQKESQEKIFLSSRFFSEISFFKTLLFGYAFAIGVLIIYQAFLTLFGFDYTALLDVFRVSDGFTFSNNF